MNCQDFENVVVDLARDQMIDVTVRQAALRHSSHCEHCEMRLNDEQELTASLRQLSLATAAPSPSSQYEAKLVAEFRNRSQSVPIASERKRVRSRYLRYAAAAVVLVAGITAVYERTIQPPVNNPGPLATSPEAGPVQPVGIGKPSGSFAVKPTGRPWLAKAHRPVTRRADTKAINAHRDLVANNNAKEITTDFIPIAYSQAPTVQEGGQVVRVEMSRSAMAQFGLPINMERYDERVKADLWLGPDGFARAIRFVQ